MGTCCEIPTILGQVNLLSSKSGRGQNWQGDTKCIVEWSDLLFVKVWGGDLSLVMIKVEKYFFFLLACFYRAKFQSHDFTSLHTLLHCKPKKQKITKFHEN